MLFRSNLDGDGSDLDSSIAADLLVESEKPDAEPSDLDVVQEGAEAEE